MAAGTSAWNDRDGLLSNSSNERERCGLGQPDPCLTALSRLSACLPVRLDFQSGSKGFLCCYEYLPIFIKRGLFVVVGVARRGMHDAGGVRRGGFGFPSAPALTQPCLACLDELLNSCHQCFVVAQTSYYLLFKAMPNY